MAETCTQCGDLRTTLNHTSEFCGFLLSTAEIRLNDNLVFQVKGNGSLYAAER